MQTVTEILIDFSASMKEKLTLTKSSILNDIIPNLNYSAKIGIKTFTASKNKIPSINTIHPLLITNKEQITSAINSLGIPKGNTPIAEAIKNSVESLKEYSAFDKKIILITDGEENCGGNYLNEVNKAQTEGINCQIHIIGIGLNSEAAKQAETIAKLSKGSFSQILFKSGTTYQQGIIRQNLSNFYNSIGQSEVNKLATFQKTTIQVNTHQINPVVETLPKNTILNIISDAAKEEKSKIKTECSTNTVNLMVTNSKSIKEQISNNEQNQESVLYVEENAELNEKIRKSSEEYLFELLKLKYGNRVKWFNEIEESNKDHDFEIIDLDGSIEYFIECKGTAKDKPTFYLTKRLFKFK